MDCNLPIDSLVESCGESRTEGVSCCTELGGGVEGGVAGADGGNEGNSRLMDTAEHCGWREDAWDEGREFGEMLRLQRDDWERPEG